MPKMGRVDFLPDLFGNLILDERVFYEEALRERGVDLLEQRPVFGSAVEKVIADGDDHLRGEEARLLQRGLDEAALVGAKIDDGGYRLLLHRRLAYHF